MDRRKDPAWNMRGSLPWLAVFCAIIAAVKPVSASEPRVVCYYTNWSVYRPGTARFNPQNINPYLCTHLIYAFGGFTKDNTLKPFDKYQDIEKGGYAKFTGLKTYNKRLKTLLAIGGWNEGSSRFSPMVAAKDRRKEFVRNAIKFLRQNHFDGLDLDWEYPAFRDGGKPRDRDNYARLVRDLRSEFERESEKTGRPRLLLTMAVPAGIEYIQKGFDVQKLNQHLDWMNLLTYDYHSAFEPAVNHHSPLYPIEPPSEYSVDSELNIDYTIQFYLDNGADRDKLVLGIPTYGRSYTLYNQDATEIGAPADGPGEQGDATREKGYLAYYEICEGFKQKPKAKKPKEDSEEDEDEDSEEDDEQDAEELEWTIVQPNPDAMGPYAFRGNQWVGYDDIDIVKKKAEYVAEKGLGGIMFWSIDNDDFRGGCHGKPYPLIEAAKEALITRLGNTDNAIVSEKKSSSRSGGRLSSRNRQTVTTTTARTTTKARTTPKKQSSLVSTTPVWNVQTPEPPTTPDPGSDFKCSDEGFFPHPRDCKKYFWCLDSGPSNLGIVAHQFTCPSGLFFNKGADSCDFARNVICKVKPTTTTTTIPTTTTTTTTTTPTTTTARTTRITTPYAPPRLVSTSRRPPSRLSTLFQRLSGSTTTSTTTRTTTTEDADPEEDIAVEEPNSEVDSEDPRVIKELIDLIRKAGGVDQLEKQLKLAESSAGGKDTTPTPAAIPKNLFERVLGQKRQQSGVKYSARANQFKNTQPTAPGQNSRVGPQNQGLDDLPEVANLRKERPQYTSVNRFRSSKATEAPQEEEDGELDTDEPSSAEEDDVQVSSSKPFIPQYVNIRRARPTTSEKPLDNDEEDSGTRFALFERNEPIARYPSDDEEEENDNEEPEYVTIRRHRLRNDDITTPKYQTIYRTRATPAETTQSIEEEIKLEESVISKSSTESTSQSPYVTLLRSRSTQKPETSTEPEVRTDARNEVTEPNEPEIVTEAETEVTTARAIVANVQISTLLNNPTESVTSPSAAPVTEPATSPPTTTTTITTTTTTTAAPITKRLFPKRIRSTTASPVTTEEPSTTTAKVSVERNYAFIRRTRPTTQVGSVSNDTPSTVSTFTRLANDIPSDSENNAFGRQRNNRFKTVVRKIRSTTPNSREVSFDIDDADYGDKKPAAVNRRRRPTFVKRVTEDDSLIASNGENGYLPRDDISTPSSRSPHIRFRKVSTTTPIPSREDSVHEASEPRNFSDNPPALVRQRGRFRPTLSASDISSLTAVDKSEQSVDKSEQYNFVPRGRSAQAIRRPLGRQILEPEIIDEDSLDLEDSEDEDSSAIRSPVDFQSRGRSRFSANEEAQTETSEITTTIRNDRKLTFPRFRPRQFIRPSPGSNTELEDEISSDDRVDNVVEERLSTVALPPRGFPNRLRFSSSTTAVPGIGNRANNPRILISRNRNSLLSRRPTITTTTTEADNTDDVALRISDDIHLSESVIEEKEHDTSSEDETSDQSQKKIVPQSEDSTQSNNNNEATSEKTDINEDSVDKLKEVGDKVKQRRVKVVYRRPSALSTPSSEATPEETSSGIQRDTTTPTTASSTPRIRRIIKKKIRPLAVTVTEPPITSTKSLEITTIEEKAEEVTTTIQNIIPDDEITVTQTDLGDPPTTEIPANTSSETEVETTTTTEPGASSTTTVPPVTTPKSRFERPHYRPTRKPFSLTTSTEAPSAFSSRTYSRKYNIGVYTTPSSSDKESSKLVTRKPLFTARPFSRRPFTTVRSTTKDIDDEEEDEYYSDEVEDEQDDKLVLVPENQLFSRGPKRPENDEEEEEEEDLYESYDEDESDEKEDDEVEDNPFKAPPKRLPFVPKTINSNAFRTSSTTTTQIPRKLKPNTSIYQSKNSNRTSIFRPSSDDSGKRTQNVPIGYTGANKANRTDITKYKPVNNITETNEEVVSTTIKFNEISTDFTTTEDDDYLSMTDYTSTDASTNSDSSFNNTSTESEITSTIDDTSLPTDYTIPIDFTEDDEYLEDLESTTEAAFTSTVLENISTIGHVFAEVPSTKEDKVQTEATTITTTTPLPETTSAKTEEAPVFRTHFDKLFSVSRVVEVSSKQDKHRLNKNNESRLIETGEIMVEKKPTVDKIGEVNRFTLIKIVEEEIPIYLTKLSHSYPVENPPNNPITIDEARNARALNKFTEVGKESLVASESINEAYRQVNQLNNANKTESEKNNLEKPAEGVVVEEKTFQIGEDGEEVNPLYLPLPMQWQFVPAAYESEKEKENKILKQAKNFDIITPRPFKTEPSTLSLEALFKTENPELYTARKIGTDDSKKLNDSQPFIVYAAPKSIPENTEGNIRKDNKLTNFVKLKFLKPELSRSIKTYAKGQEFRGLSTSTEDATIKYPVSITILESDQMQDVTTTRPVFTTISDEEMNTAKTNPLDISVALDTTTTINIMSTAPSITTESSTENPPATMDATEVTTDSTESSTLVSIITRGALSLNAKNRPKLTFPRRYQSKNSNITRISVSPLANLATTPRSYTKNNQTVPNSSKFNRTNNFSQSKSRFSSSRSQNVPIDIRVKKGKDVARSYQKQTNTTSEVLRIQPISTTESSTRKLYFKPIRPSILRGPSFVPRKANTPPVPQVSEE